MDTNILLVACSLLEAVVVMVILEDKKLLELLMMPNGNHRVQQEHLPHLHMVLMKDTVW